MIQFDNITNFVKMPERANPYDPKFTQKTVKHTPSIMVWGCFSAKDSNALYFLLKRKTMNTDSHLSILKKKLIFLSQSKNVSLFNKIQHHATFQKD